MELLHKDSCILYLSVRDIVGRSVDVVQLLRHVRQFNGILVHSEKDREILINCRDSKEWKEKIFLLEFRTRQRGGGCTAYSSGLSYGVFEDPSDYAMQFGVRYVQLE